MASSVVLVAQFSESFDDVWQQLATDLSVDVQYVAGTELRIVPPGLAALVLAAGGEECAALEWLEHCAVPAGVPVLAIGADPNRRTAAQMVSRGATDYFVLPEDVELLRNAWAAAVARRNEVAAREAHGTAGELSAFRAILGESPALTSVLHRAARLVAHPQATALIVGETGTGKELLARAIHESGPCHGAPFVPVHCSALPGHLIESELFGHERGAFTDAHVAKPGLFEVADGGTLFLDEIGSLPVELQAKLLRVLEDREVRRIGGTKSRRVNLRILAATNEDLGHAVAAGRFREDLYYRIGGVTLTLPPLRERGDDISLIAGELLKTLAGQYRLPVPPFEPEAKRALLNYPWPGNVRELKNAIERALLLSAPGELNVAELLPNRHHNGSNGGPLPFPASLDAITSAAARAMLAMAEGNVSEAARRLRVSRRRLRRLLLVHPDSRN
jgi:DNA-binding NtrC family response regulator